MSTTKLDLSEQYTGQLKSASDKRQAAIRILESLNSLTYTEKKTPLSKSDKKEILDLIISNIKGDIHLKEADNQEYLALVAFMMSKLETT